MVSPSEASNDINTSNNEDVHTPDFEAMAWDTKTGDGSKAPTFFWDEHACHWKNMGIAQEGLPPPQEEPPKASALDTVLSQGALQAEAGVLGHCRIFRHNQPKDPPANEKGLGLCQHHCQSGGHGGE